RADANTPHPRGKGVNDGPPFSPAPPRPVAASRPPAVLAARKPARGNPDRPVAAIASRLCSHSLATLTAGPDQQALWHRGGWRQPTESGRATTGRQAAIPAASYGARRPENAGLPGCAGLPSGLALASTNGKSPGPTAPRDDWDRLRRTAPTRRAAGSA